MLSLITTIERPEEVLWEAEVEEVDMDEDDKVEEEEVFVQRQEKTISTTTSPHRRPVLRTSNHNMVEIVMTEIQRWAGLVIEKMMTLSIKLAAETVKKKKDKNKNEEKIATSSLARPVLPPNHNTEEPTTMKIWAVLEEEKTMTLSMALVMEKVTKKMEKKVDKETMEIVKITIQRIRE